MKMRTARELATELTQATAERARPARGAAGSSDDDATTSNDASEHSAGRPPELPSWVVSTLVHTVGLLVLALIPMATERQQTITALDSAIETREDEPILEVPAIDVQKPSDVEATNPLELETLPDPGEAAVGETLDALDPNDALAELFASALDAFGRPDGKDGFGMGDFGDGRGNGDGNGKGEGSFFKAKARGRKFVFLVDNSTSMRQGRFETARAELVKTIAKLEKDQSFYVMLFSDTAYPLFWPQPAKELVAATKQNKMLLAQWLMTVELCSGTKGKLAIEKAIALKPDVIFLLGDGAFADETIATANALNQESASGGRKIPIHVLGMEVNDVDRQVLEQLAKGNDGTYSDVELDPDLAAAAAANPIKRNRTRGPVWGVTLPRP